MAAKEISVKRYVVRLSGDEREQLEALIRKGKSPAQRLLKARILLKADVSESGEGWSDSRIIKALETSASMVYRVRKQLVEEGVEGGGLIDEDKLLRIKDFLFFPQGLTGRGDVGPILFGRV